ncbi:hypothetical protein A3D81_01520 [Candidatus Curtissbacteria bacterium RIFCSPHIGHO2_02_FULL_40_17]|uniref:EamA domain-containing protein n=3 Tax=Candidatus Curtissiibacteriota TaxID=1752717 RepID=A0A1F5GJ12_9BACT|nr:MAG: hypothetical protein A2693_03015 [Candidatus Curtissbacteria bacterium RIFCSPHIGHO2_01_FULL_40_12]OGD91797.1 MAG: hypothetical protein A3D81_01520 [Candidatus Curtissbacteria bacterium RIFCSPHIGHO2_02_FULL_40_17]OGE03369.1 MAG: hypothetical protein A3F45_03680 [Candidatus Curtissbacteria bacterium RIFCSPHIGHO2_12_FULL_41_17]
MPFNTNLAGFGLALISSLFFSFYIVPRKLSKLSPITFSFIMSFGFAVSAITLYMFQPLINFHETISFVLLWSVAAGIIWAVSFVLFVTAIDYIGLSRSNQWKNLQGPIAAILGLLILGEFATTNPIFAILAAIAIFVSAVFLTATTESKKINLKGVYLGTLAGIGFGSVAVIQKYVTSNVGIYSQQVVWSISIFLGMLIFIFLTKKMKETFQTSKKELLLSLSAGILYLGASLFQLFSYRFLDVSISFTIIQMNAFWTVLIGILVFKEIDLKKYYKNIALGFVFTLIGIVFLFFARK